MLALRSPPDRVSVNAKSYVGHEPMWGSTTPASSHPPHLGGWNGIDGYERPWRPRILWSVSNQPKPNRCSPGFE